MTVEHVDVVGTLLHELSIVYLEWTVLAYLGRRCEVLQRYLCYVNSDISTGELHDGSRGFNALHFVVDVRGEEGLCRGGGLESAKPRQCDPVSSNKEKKNGNKEDVLPANR